MKPCRSNPCFDHGVVAFDQGLGGAFLYEQPAPVVLDDVNAQFFERGHIGQLGQPSFASLGQNLGARRKGARDTDVADSAFDLFANDCGNGFAAAVVRDPAEIAIDPAAQLHHDHLKRTTDGIPANPNMVFLDAHFFGKGTEVFEFLGQCIQGKGVELNPVKRFEIGPFMKAAWQLQYGGDACPIGQHGKAIGRRLFQERHGQLTRGAWLGLHNHVAPGGFADFIGQYAQHHILRSPCTGAVHDAHDGLLLAPAGGGQTRQ